MKRKIIKLIAAVLLSMLLIMNIRIIRSELKNKESFLDDMAYAVLPVTGGSMEPMLTDGDAVLVKQVPFEEYTPGDTAVFVMNGELIIHTVMAKNEDTLITKGLANDYEDPPVGREDCKAKLLFRLPFLGTLWRISSDPLKFSILALLLTILVFGKDIFPALYSLIFERKNRNGNSEENN